MAGRGCARRERVILASAAPTLPGSTVPRTAITTAAIPPYNPPTIAPGRTGTRATSTAVRARDAPEVCRRSRQTEDA